MIKIKHAVIGIAVALVIGVVAGYFMGRTHLQYQIASALNKFGEFDVTGSELDTEPAAETNPFEESRKQIEETRATIAAEKAQSKKNRLKYADKIALYDFKADMYSSVLDGKIPGVEFKLKNKGDRTLSKVEVTVYFKDAADGIISEEIYLPVYSESWDSSTSKQLKPGYIWQMERGSFLSAKSVPDEWKAGNAVAKITDVEFLETE